METTKLVIEHIIAGLLVLMGLILFTFSYFPTDMNNFILSLSSLDLSILGNAPVLLVPFTALAYSVGIIFEYIGELLFSKLEDRIKKDRLGKFVNANLESLSKSPLLARSNDTKELSTELYGEMRYYILSQNLPLYADIEAQVNRFRLLRVLFIVEMIFSLSILNELRKGFSLMLIFILVLFVILTLVNYAAVNTRLQRYCRSIERSYKCLVLDNPTAHITKGMIEKTNLTTDN
jgi:hypothetical protein